MVLAQRRNSVSFTEGQGKKKKAAFWEHSLILPTAGAKFPFILRA